MPLYDFACKRGHITEERRGYDDCVISCRSCGKPADRVPVYAEQFISGETVAKGNATRAGNITDPKGRTRVSVFQEACQEVAYAEAKADNEVGRELPKPNLYKAGVNRARQMGANIRAT